MKSVLITVGLFKSDRCHYMLTILYDLGEIILTVLNAIKIPKQYMML